MSSSRKRATIGQVAREAGVARSTVSRAFSVPERLSAETVKHVLEVAERLGYKPNPVAQALSTGASKNIAVIVPDIANPFFPPLIRAAQRQAEEHGYCIFLGDTGEAPERERELLERFANQVAGIVLVSPRLGKEQVLSYATCHPIVLINQDIDGMMRVLIDSGLGMEEAVRHLSDLGHRHIVYLSGPASSWANKRRKTVFKQVSKGLGIKISAVSAQKPTHEAGRTSVAQVLATGATAAIAFDDLLAQGLLAGLADTGIKVPDEFSVIGCDDVLGATTYPPLTTVSNRCAEVAEIAVSMLIGTLKADASSDVRHVLDTHLVIRDTTAQPRGNMTPSARKHT